MADTLVLVRATPLVEPQHGDNSPDLANALGIAIGRLQRRLRAERSDDSLTLTRISVLATLQRCGPQSPTALAALERVQPPSMTRVIAALEQLGLAERLPHSSDRRQWVIAITKRGQELLAEERRRRDVWLLHAIEALDETDVKTLVEALPVLERLVET